MKLNEENRRYEGLTATELERIEDSCTILDIDYDIIANGDKFDVDIDKDVPEDVLKELRDLVDGDKEVKEKAEKIIEDKIEGKVEVDYGLKELMKDYNIETFVPLSKIVNCKPQYLYSRKIVKTGEYNYNSIAKYLIKVYKENLGIQTSCIMTDEELIAFIVEEAGRYVKEKNANKGKVLTDVEKCIKMYKKLNKMLEDLTEDDLKEYNDYIKKKGGDC